MKNLFNSISLKKPTSNVFDLTHDVKLSCDMGNLVPVCVMEAVPGDKFNIGCESLIRFAPLVAPVMHRMDVTMHYFFVPNRILWDNWEKWITDPTSTAALPTMVFSNQSYGELHDYLGIPAPGTNGITVSAFPFAAYQAIYNEYYRDQNLITEVDYKLNNGNNQANADLSILRKRAWEHDYFTASLPFAQKGAAVSIPFQDARIKANYTTPGTTAEVGWDVSELPTPDTKTLSAKVGDPNNNNILDHELYAEMGGSAPLINDLRRAFRLQEWLEKNARAGTRYIENIWAHFAVKSSDARLQRPEYITGVKSPVVISEVLNTTGQVDGVPQGTMAGHAVSVTSGKHGSYFCEEHGYIIGIMSIMPKTAYQQGLPRHFIKKDQYSYYWPEFAHIGEQEVFNEEIYAESTNREGVFGYVPRYAEYKYMPSRVAGDFKTTLDFWHLGRIFSTEPTLSQEFIECVPDKRIFAVDSTEHSLYCHVLNRIKAVRRMPKFGNPSF